MSIYGIFCCRFRNSVAPLHTRDDKNANKNQKRERRKDKDRKKWEEFSSLRLLLIASFSLPKMFSRPGTELILIQTLCCCLFWVVPYRNVEGEEKKMKFWMFGTFKRLWPSHAREKGNCHKKTQIHKEKNRKFLDLLSWKETNILKTMNNKQASQK